MERRAGHRAVRHDKVRVGVFPSATHGAQLVNIGAGGALLHATLRVQPYSIVRCRVLHQVGLRAMVLDLAGYVVRRSAEGFALQWDDTSAARVAVRLLQDEREPQLEPDKRSTQSVTNVPGT